MRVILYADPEWLTSAASVARTALLREEPWPKDGILLYEKGDEMFVVKRWSASISVTRQIKHLPA